MGTVRSFLQHHPVITYVVAVLFISYAAYGIVVGPKLLRGGSEQAGDAEYILFPIMEFGLLVTAVALTAISAGGKGLRALFAPMGRWRVNPLWYIFALLLPPALALSVLLAFSVFVSPVFTPKLFLIGALFGLPAFIEEIGWTGYAFPALRRTSGALGAALVIGVVWGIWHAPVVDYLGAAAPHGAYWLAFYLAFIAILLAMRVLISFIYVNTGSLLLAQLMHVSMTASLVVFDPLRVTPAQEAAWYGGYAAALGLVAALVVVFVGAGLARLHAPAPAA